MLFRVIALATMFCLLNLSATAQKILISDNLVAATVDSSTGQITVLSNDVDLTYPGTSYLSMKIDGRYYTNNAAAAPTSISDPIGSGTSPKSPDILLDNGLSTKSGNTVRTVWQDTINALSIIQTVTAGGSGALVVITVSVASAQPHAVQGQYLIDDLVGTVINPYIMNSNGYTDHSYDVRTSNVPSFYLEFDKTPGHPSEPGMIVLNDSFAPVPVGLMQPSAVYHLDWDLASDYTFGAPVQPGTTSDMATLIQWPQVNTKSGETKILKFAIGAAAMRECSSQVYARSFFPRSIEWNDTTQRFTTNPFPVLSLLYNNTSSTLKNVIGYQSYAPQNLAVRTADTIHSGDLAPNAVAVFKWIDSVTYIPQGTNLFDANLTLNFSATGYASIVGGSCQHSISIQEPPLRNHWPVAILKSRNGSFDSSICNARFVSTFVTDTGSQPVKIKAIKQDSVYNMHITIIDPQPSDTAGYSVSVIDSTKEGIAIIEITDMANGILFDTIRYCTIADAKAPTATVVTRGQVKFEDQGAWQSGIDSIYYTDTSNIILPEAQRMNCLPDLTINAAARTAEIARALVHVIDCAGNELKYPLFLSPNDGVAISDRQTQIRVYPNPASDVFTIELPDESQVEIVDALGRTVAGFSAVGEYTFDASGLGQGTYLLRAANSTIRIMKQ